MAEETQSPISAATPPPANPLGDAVAARAATLKLKPVIRKPGSAGLSPVRPQLRKPPAPAAPAPAAAATAAPPPMEQLKSVTQKLKTQKLKGVTQQIPQQAILRKTGIIADQDLTEAQKQASKSRTARISLSDAIGVAPVRDEAAPMKTIRIKRPVDVKQPAASEAAPAASAPAPADAPAPVEAEPVTATQRKTLKIARPGGAVRPAPKFGLKKPGAAAPVEEAAASSDVADVPDIPEIPPVAPPAAMADGSSQMADVPPGLLVFDFILQFAACCAMGFLAWLLYTDVQTAWF